MKTKVLKQSVLAQIERQTDERTFAVTLYDSGELDRDGESIDLSRVTAREPVTLQIDHDRSVLMTVGTVTNIHAEGQRLRGTLTFAPEGVSEIADQVHRQVVAGITSTVSIGFLGRFTQAPEGHTVWTDIEVYELSFVSIPSSPGARVDGKTLAQWLGRAVDDEDEIVVVFDERDVALPGEQVPAVPGAVAHARADLSDFLASLGDEGDLPRYDGLRRAINEITTWLESLTSGRSVGGDPVISMRASELTAAIQRELRPLVSHARGRLRQWDDNEPVLILADDPDEQVSFDVGDLRDVLGTTLHDAISPVVRHELTAALNYARGRID